MLVHNRRHHSQNGLAQSTLHACSEASSRHPILSTGSEAGVSSEVRARLPLSPQERPLCLPMDVQQLPHLFVLQHGMAIEGLLLMVTSRTIYAVALMCRCKNIRALHRLPQALTVHTHGRADPPHKWRLAHSGRQPGGCPVSPHGPSQPWRRLCRFVSLRVPGHAFWLTGCPATPVVSKAPLQRAILSQSHTARG